MVGKISKGWCTRFIQVLQWIDSRNMKGREGNILTVLVEEKSRLANYQRGTVDFIIAPANWIDSIISLVYTEYLWASKIHCHNQ